MRDSSNIEVILGNFNVCLLAMGIRLLKLDYCKGIRHAKSREPWNLVPRHFWKEIQTFDINQSLKEIYLLKYWENQVEMSTNLIISIHKHP